MSDLIVFAGLIGLAIGQVIAVYHGPIPALTYYLCVAPLSYFQIWSFGTWEPERVCGVTYIVGAWLLYYPEPDAPRFRKNPIMLLALYCVLATLVGVLFWPMDSIASRSSVYGPLRPVVSILNWLIVIGVSWRIALTLSKPGAWQKIRPIIIPFGLLLCVYGLYQCVANRFGLPMTDLRVAFRDLTSSGEGEAHAAYLLGGQEIFRPGSLVGEPKALGALCAFWIALVLSNLFDRRINCCTMLSLAIFTLTLWVTASTGAWLGALCCLGLFVIVGYKKIGLATKIIAFMVIASFILMIALLTCTADVGPRSSEKGHFSSVIEERFSNRLTGERDLSKDYGGDYFEANKEWLAVDVLCAHPQFIISGTGLGGISFYIAELLGGVQFLSPTPSIGFLLDVCNSGIIGLLLAGHVLRQGLCPLWSRRSGSHPALGIAFAGTAALTQHLIFAPALFPVSIGLLLASGFHPDWITQDVTGHDYHQPRIGNLQPPGCLERST